VALNRWSWPEEFENWELSGVVVTPNVGIAPDGTMTADRIDIPAYGGSVYSTEYIFQGLASWWSLSFFIKPITPLSIQFSESDGGNYFLQNFNAQIDSAPFAFYRIDGWAGYPTSWDAYPDGWYRCKRSIQISSGPYGAGNHVTKWINRSSGAISFYLWGAKKEEASAVSAYVARSGWSSDALYDPRSEGGPARRIWTLPKTDGDAKVNGRDRRLLLYGFPGPEVVVPVPTFAGIPRTPIALVLLHLDYCGRVFGVAPCLAVGTPCYNTWKSCRYLPAFLKTEKVYKFSSYDTPVPFDGVRPYVRTVHLLPTEIKTNLTVSARVTVEFEDDLDYDVDTDPYVRTRPAGPPRSFFKRLLARNPNYKGRTVEIFEGFLGDAEGEFKKKWVGHLENVTLGKGVIKMESVDLLKNLSKIEVPPKLDIKLAVDLSAAQTGGMTLSSVEGLDDAGYVRIGDEIIGYAYRDVATKQLLTLTRSAFSTLAAEHKAKEKVQKVRYFAPANPWDILLDMLRVDSQVPDEYIDLDAFSYFREWPGGDVDFSAVISEPEKLDTLFMEVVDLLDAKAWVAEDLKITVRRNLQNEPGRSYRTLTDESHHVSKTMSVDLNEKSRLTRMFVYWGKKVIGKHEEPSSYDRLDIAVDADAEGAYGDTVEKKSYCRWISSSYLQEETAAQYVKNIAMRRVRRNRDAQPIIAASLDLKDADIKTGEFIRVSTDEVADLNGAPVLAEIFQVVKREHKGTRVNVSLLRLSQRKVAFIAPAGTPSYASASDQQKEYGFITVADGRMPDESPGYHIW
jgi:hypothetical protein